MNLFVKALRIHKDQRGASMAEFVIVAGLFFTLIVGIIEFGRLLYTHNALADAARRAARYAVLHEKNDPCVQYVAVYGETHVTKSGSPGSFTCTASGPALINGMTTGNVTVAWAGADQDADPSTPPDTDYGMNLGTATVTIVNYDFTLSIPFFRQRIRMPAYRTTLTAESAGETP
jgi:Flp pilus assembly protein TadG